MIPCACRFGSFMCVCDEGYDTVDGVSLPHDQYIYIYIYIWLCNLFTWVQLCVLPESFHLFTCARPWSVHICWCLWLKLHYTHVHCQCAYTASFVHVRTFVNTFSGIYDELWLWVYHMSNERAYCHLGWRTLVLKCNKTIMTDWACVDYSLTCGWLFARLRVAPFHKCIAF